MSVNRESVDRESVDRESEFALKVALLLLVAILKEKIIMVINRQKVILLNFIAINFVTVV
jgi:hypothetical protein